ncbi:uncharacterized protein LOC113331917 [Papaver somniferum]|uniref:uncharacterized protein LOC113331917 n=1 Tax=Papaver somniferum TaxID=3469 RepID=UPI000E7017ED|nr:uncharacterized protein LOC113331917 [Papaver somniferum]
MRAFSEFYEKGRNLIPKSHRYAKGRDLIQVVIMDSSNASNSNATNTTCDSLPSSSATQTKDPAWEWGERQDLANQNIITFLLCKKLIRGGGITRLKEHLLHIKGNVSSCPNVSIDIMNKVSLVYSVKRTKKSHRDNIDLAYRRANNSNEGSDADTDVEEQKVEIDGNMGSRGASAGVGASQLVSQNQTKRKRISQSNSRGPIDLYMKTDHQKTQQATLERDSAVKEKLMKTAWKCISAWMTENSVSFNTVRCPSFKEMIYAIGDYGKAMPPPSYHQIRTNLFKDRLVEMKKFVDTFREHWKRFGCSIMSDGWTDGKKRHLINFLEVINDVGEENIVQFITDNGSNFKKAGKDLMLEYPNMFWTPCGAHCVQLMLEELGDKLPRIKTAVILGKRLVTYIYAHFQVLSLMREMIGGELHRSTKTRFATQYYTLESLAKYKTHLQIMFVNDKWLKMRFAKETMGINVLKIVTSGTFWEDVDYSCRVLKPLVKVVRLVDIERKPTMPCFYEAMRIAREKLEENFSQDDSTWDVIKAIFDKRWKNNFNHALHCAAYYLNPSIFYKVPAHLMDNDLKYIEIKRGLHTAMQRLIPNEEDLEKATTELRDYSDANGILGTTVCKKRRYKDQPHDWWITYGGIDTPNLQKFAIRVLSLTCSASPCERNWSTFQNLHSKKRNRIKQQKLNDSVFIQYNKKLERRYKEISQYNDDPKAHDPIFLDERDDNDEWLALENLDDLVVQGDNVILDDLQDIVGEKGMPVVGKSACISRRKSTYPTDSEYSGYDTDDLMLDSNYGLLGGDDGATEDYDIYDESNDFD